MTPAGKATAISEREAKFEVDRDFDPPDLRDLVGGTERLPEQRLRTVYFDTPDRRLGGRGISLRHRVVETVVETVVERGEQPGSEQSWTLKLPESPQDAFISRHEMSWPGDRETVPPEAVAILRGLVRRAPLQPIAELDTTRRRLLLFGAGRTAAWGELDDDAGTVIGGPGDGSWFRQIELELTGDRPEDADAVLRCLRQAGAKPTSQSKVGIALGDLSRKPDAPAGRTDRKKRKNLTLSDTVAEVIASNLDRLLEHDYLLRLHRESPDPHDVHQARVATRRMRSDLNMLASVIDPVWLDHTTGELRWIAGSLGEVRDLDVLATNLDPGLAVAVAPQRAAAAKKLSGALVSRRYLDLLDRLNAARDRTPVLFLGQDPGAGTRAKDAFPALLGRQWRSLRRQIRKYETEPAERELHKVRIRAKRLRYAAETAEPFLGSPARRIAKHAETIQDAIGELRDRRVAQDWLRRRMEETSLSSEEAFASGVLFEQHRARQPALRERWVSEWKSLNRKRNRKWLRGRSFPLR